MRDTAESYAGSQRTDAGGGTKVIPLVVDEADIAEAERICSEADWVIEVKPYKKKKVGCHYGSEVFITAFPMLSLL